MSDADDFRSQVRDILEREVPAVLRGKAGDPKAHVWGGRRVSFAYPESRAWLELAAQRGWTAPRWPRQYGGGGLTAEHARVLEAEIARLGPSGSARRLRSHDDRADPAAVRQRGSQARAPATDHAGKIRWCQGYSEPNAGSDLASLQTAAVLDGDSYLVNGQKVWTSYGDLADWMFMLVRTDPGASKRQTGITFLLVDMATPGVTVRPIRLISGASPFCETFFSDVRVPVSNVVSEVNAGWTVAKALLGHERAMIANVMGSGGRRDGANSRWWEPAAQPPGRSAARTCGR